MIVATGGAAHPYEAIAQPHHLLLSHRRRRIQDLLHQVQHVNNIFPRLTPFARQSLSLSLPYSQRNARQNGAI